MNNSNSSLNVGPLTVAKTGMPRGTLGSEVAVITGGGSNIGLGAARSLAWLGARVVIAGRNEAKGSAAADLINRENKPGAAIFVQTDVSSQAAVKNLAEKALAAFGKVDILLNNAMIMNVGHDSLLNTAPEALDQQYAVTVRGVLHCIQAFVPAMLERKHGVVGYLASGFRMARGGGSYFPIKGAGSALMMSLAAELGDVKDSGVAIFMLVPGNVVESPADEQSRFAGLNIGYKGPLSPEDSGASLAYAIVHAAEIHGSGVTHGQVQRHMGWPFPNPELLPKGDFDRLRDGAAVRIYGYIGKGFSQPGLARYSLNRADSVPGELKPFVALMKEIEGK